MQLKNPTDLHNPENPRNPTTGRFWTAERVAILKARRAANWPASAIARLLGCTKNAVIGKGDRLGLPGSCNPGGRPRKRKTGFRRRKPPLNAWIRRRGPRAPVELPPRPHEPASLRIALTDLEPGACRWISGDDGHCCGHRTLSASPYCGFHGARATRTVRRQQFA